jgi:hypothetical protein
MHRQAFWKGVMWMLGKLFDRSVDSSLFVLR